MCPRRDQNGIPFRGLFLYVERIESYTLIKEAIPVFITDFSRLYYDHASYERNFVLIICFLKSLF